jgi:hypothetical protein
MKSLPIADFQLPIEDIPCAEVTIGNWQSAIGNHFNRQSAIGNRQCSYVAA